MSTNTKQALKTAPKKPEKKPQTTALETVEVGAAFAEFGLQKTAAGIDLPQHRTARPLRQAQVLQMQNHNGNGYVQCMISQSAIKEKSRQQPKHEPHQYITTPIKPAAIIQRNTVGNGQNITTSRTNPKVYWSVSRSRTTTYLIPTTSLSLQEIGLYIYGDIEAGKEIATANGIINLTTLIEPGKRLKVSPLKKFKNGTPLAVRQYRDGPWIPHNVDNPLDWLASIGVSSPENYLAQKNHLDTLLGIDFARILSALEESNLIRRVQREEEVISILQRWGEVKLITNPNWYPEGGEYFDKLLEKLQSKSKKIGYFDEVTDYYSMLFNRFARKNEVKALRDKYSKSYRQYSGIAEVSFFDEVVVGTIKGLPGGLAAGFGRLVGMLPGEWANDVEDWFTDRGRDWMEFVEYGDPEMIEKALSGSKLAVSGATMLNPRGALQLIRNASKLQGLIKGFNIINEAQKIISSVKGSLQNLSQKVQEFVSLLQDSDKLLRVLTGLEEDNSGLSELILNTPIEEKSEKKKPTNKKGVFSMVGKIGTAINHIRRRLKPIFQVRQGFIKLMNSMGSFIFQVPLAVDLIDLISQQGKIRSRSSKGVVGDFANQLAELLTEKADQISGAVTEKFNGLAGLELVNPDSIINFLTNFAYKKLIRKIPEINDAINLDFVSMETVMGYIKDGVNVIVPQDWLTGLLRPTNEFFQGLINEKLLPKIQPILDGVHTVTSLTKSWVAKDFPKVVKKAFVIQRSPANKPLGDRQQANHSQHKRPIISAMPPLRKGFIQRSSEDIVELVKNALREGATTTIRTLEEKFKHRKRVKRIDVKPFECDPKEYSIKEFKRQIRLQEIGINVLKVNEWKANRDEFRKKKKSANFKAKFESEHKKARKNARKDEIKRLTKKRKMELKRKYKKEVTHGHRKRMPTSSKINKEAEQWVDKRLKGQAALHIDTIAGGSRHFIPGRRAGFGDASINSIIGPAWQGSRIEAIDKAVTDALAQDKGDLYMNVKLDVIPK